MGIFIIKKMIKVHFMEFDAVDFRNEIYVYNWSILN